mgnify:FL=1
MHRIYAILYKEFKQMRRDTTMLRLLILLPIIQILIFGLAINTEVKHIPTVVFDQCRQQESRELIDVLVATDYYDVIYYASSIKEVNEKINSGEAIVGIIFPPDMVKKFKHGDNVPIQLIVDASDNMSASSAINVAQLAINKKAEQMQLSSLSYNQNLVVGKYDLRIRAWYNPDFISANYIIPSIIGIVLMMTLIMVASISIVREKEEGTLEQLLISPLKPIELIIGKIVPYICVGYIQMIIAICVGYFGFNIPIKGSLILFILLTTIFMLAILSLGILISTVAQNQMQAMQLSFFVLLPSILLSGFMFPRVAMPDFFYYISMILPMTHYVEISRGIFLKEIGLEYLYQPTLSLIFFTIIVLSLSIWRFKKIYLR